MSQQFGVGDSCKKLLRKLCNRRYFGGKHTEEKSVLRALNHLPNDERKLALED